MAVEKTYEWLKLLTLNFFGWLFIYADRTVLNPVMPAIQSTFHLNNVSLGLVTSVFFFTYTVFQVPFARLADRVQPKLVIGLGGLFFGVMTVLSGFVTSFGVFLVLRAFVGFGEATFYGASFGLSSQAIPDKYLTLGLAVINAGQAAGQILGTIVSSVLVLQYHHDWRMPFVLVGVPTMLIGSLYLILIKPKSNHVQTQTNSLGHHKINYPALIRTQLIGVYVMLFASIYGQTTLLTWLPLFLTNHWHFSGRSVGFLTVIVPLIAVPSALFFARINDRLKRIKGLMTALVSLTAISLVAVVMEKNSEMLVLALVIYGIVGKMTIDPLLLYTVKKQAGKYQLATTFGVYNFFGMLASIMAPMITGLFMDITGYIWPGFVLAAVLLMAGLCYFNRATVNESVK